MSFALTVAAHLLIALLLLRLGPEPERRPVEDAPLTTFTVAPAAEEAPKPAPKAQVARAPAPKARTTSSSPAPAAAATTPAPVATAPPKTLMLPGGMELFEAADIGKMHGRDGDSGGADGAGDSVAAVGPGEGPGGQKLYNAEWQREPSRAELAGYLANGAPPGSWALIACRTIEDFHVDNCRSLGEGPAGSGLARAMRQAAWQFRVRPPRIGGKTMVGAWVRIRFDFDKAPGGDGTN